MRPASHRPREEKACFIRIRQKQAKALSQELKGSYALEAARPITLHLALPQKLIDGEYLSLPSSRADGLYDTHTRDAIRKWQATYGDEETGVLTDDEIPHLQHTLKPSTFGEDRKSWRDDVSFISFLQPLPANSKSPPLIRIFQMDMLGIERTSLEQITGPAKYVHRRSDGVTTFTYMVDMCEVTAYEENDRIEGYSLHATPRCTFPITDFTPHTKPSLTLADMTLEELHVSFADHSLDNSLIIGLCLKESCGNNKAASLSFVAEGNFYNNYVRIAASASVADKNGEKVKLAEKQWLSAMTGFHSDRTKQDYINKGTFNCDHHYNQAGLHAMRDVPVQYFFFGGTYSDLRNSVNSLNNKLCK